MGNIDRIVSIIIAALIPVLCFTNTISDILGTILLVVAGIFIVTGIIKICLLYLQYGLKTYTRK